MLGAVMLIAAALILYVGNKPEMQAPARLSLPEQFRPAQQALEDCIHQRLEAATRLIGIQGGYINIDVQSINVNNISVPYWYTPENGKIITRQEAEKRLGERIAADAKTCTRLDVPGFSFAEPKTARADVRIADEHILTTVIMPVTVTYGDTKATIDEFQIDLDADLGTSLTDAQRITDQLAEDKTGIDLSLQLSMPSTNTIYNVSRLEKIVLMRSEAQKMTPPVYDFAFAVRMAEPQVNLPPVIEPVAPVKLGLGQSTTIQVNAYDPEGGRIQYSIISSIMTIDQNGLITTQGLRPGKNTAMVKVTDQQGLKEYTTIEVDTE
jgi:hypothetical protein